MRFATTAALFALLASCNEPVESLGAIGGGAIGGVGAVGGGGNRTITCGVGFYETNGTCVALPVFWTRDFRLNQSADSTPTYPANTAAASSWGDCTISSGTTWVCNKPDAGGTFSVAQGTSPIAATDPLGHIGRDDVTFNNAPSLSTASDIGTPVFNHSAGNTAMWCGYATAHTTGIGGVKPGWDLRPTGTNIIARGGETSGGDWRALYGATTSDASNGPDFGLGCWGIRWTGNVDQHLVADAMGITDTQALASVTYTSGGTFYFFNDGATFQDTIQGFGFDFHAWTADIGATTLEQDMQEPFGLVPDSSNPLTFTAAGRRILIDGSNRAWPYAQNTPIVSSRGLEMHPGADGTRPIGNGMVNAQAFGNNLGSLTAVNAPTITTKTAAGPFYDLVNTATTTKEGALLDDTDGTNWGGVKGSIAPADNETTTGEYTIAVWASNGTAEVMQNKLTIGFLTDGTITPSLGTLSAKNLGGCTVTTTASPARYVCHVDIEGSPTSIRGVILEGTQATDQASSTIYQYQASIGYGTPNTIIDNTAVNPDVAYIPAATAETFPTGKTLGFEVECSYTLDYKLGNEVNGQGGSGEYIFDTYDGGTSETKLMMIQRGAIGDGHSATDTLVRAGLRSSAYNGTCAGGTFGNGGTDLTSPGTLGDIAEGTPVVERWVVKPAAAIAGVPRVNQWIYFDTCADLSSCHATTLRASNTSGTMCASDGSDTYAQFGARTGSATPGSNNNFMQGAIGKCTVRLAI